MFNLFSFSKIICSLKTNSLIVEWQGLTGRDELLCSCSTVNTTVKTVQYYKNDVGYVKLDALQDLSAIKSGLINITAKMIKRELN